MSDESARWLAERHSARDIGGCVQSVLLALALTFLSACSPLAAPPSANAIAHPHRVRDHAGATSATSAEAVAESCLRSMDVGDFDALWAARDPSLEAAGIDRAKLEQVIRAARPVGVIPPRTRITSKRLTMLPHRPIGEYVVVEWETSFPEAGSAIELVAVSKGVDGRWRFVASRIAMAEATK